MLGIASKELPRLRRWIVDFKIGAICLLQITGDHAELRIPTDGCFKELLIETELAGFCRIVFTLPNPIGAQFKGGYEVLHRLGLTG